MTTRKPLSKRIRFEVFKRDGFICQYCGAKPPEVILHVDYVIALARGGDDDIDNLITSCLPCNLGKGARDLTVAPATVAEKAALIAEKEEQLRGYNALLDERRQRLEDDVWRVFKHWTGADETTRDRFRSVSHFVDRLGVHDVLEAVDIATSRRRGSYAEWKYFCGVCWKKIRDRDG